MKPDILGGQLSRLGSTSPNCANVLQLGGATTVTPLALGNTSNPVTVFGTATGAEADKRVEELNAIVHPAVRNRARRQSKEIAAANPHAVVIYVVAILIESGAYREVDKIIVVRCEREQQIERAMARPGAIEAGVLARLERQMPLEKKLTFADYVIDTSGTREDTVRQTEVVYQNLRELA